MPTASKEPSPKFDPGQILVVLHSGFSAMPAFFKVVASSSPGMACLRTIGAKKTADGKFVPGEAEYHDSLCRVREDVVETWCGSAQTWDGKPC